MIDRILEELTGGLSKISSGTIASFRGGPLGNISGVLDRFDLSFTELLHEFNDTYNGFKMDISSGTSDLFDLRPINLPRFSSILQIGSKHPSVQYSLELKKKLWQKLNATFTSSTFNGVKIPGLDLGETFADKYPTDEDFPGDYFSGEQR